MATGKLKPIHPGEVLREEFLKPFGISAEDLANSIGASTQNIREIVSEKQSVTADTALRLSKYFGTSAQFWLGLQSDYDLDVTQEMLGNRLEKEIVPLAA
ncbi:MAG: HigA family addiction module antidote protein [Pyrinomonadaceae bacterium]|nr:HigA family addiction module antidote protein [Pyrinomonadaceae bacterium]